MVIATLLSGCGEHAPDHDEGVGKFKPMVEEASRNAIVRLSRTPRPESRMLLETALLFLASEQRNDL